MIMVLIGILLFVGVFGGMGYLLYQMINKTDPEKMDRAGENITDETSVQNFIPFQRIENGMVDLGGHQYRMLIEVSSINYHLKTGKEKELVELSFQRFINSLTFPISFYVQTRLLDNTNYLKILQKDLDEANKEFPQLAGYAQSYYQNMTHLNTHIGNSKQKKKYIVVSYDEAIGLENLTDVEKSEYAYKELHTRCHLLLDGLAGVGLKGSILPQEEVVKTMFSSFHKDNHLFSEYLTNDNFLRLIADNPNAKIHQIGNDEKIDWILHEAQLRLENEVFKEDVPPFIKENVMYAVQLIDNLRAEVSGVYQSRSENYQQWQEEDEDDMEEIAVPELVMDVPVEDLKFGK